MGCQAAGMAGRQGGPAGSGAAPAPDAEFAELWDAIPAQPVVEPTRQRHLLVFSLCEGFAHGSIAATEAALKFMGEKTGAFDVTVSVDMKVFEAENLEQYDAILFNNTTNLSFEDPEHRRSLLEFVRSGKGVIGIHGATDNFSNWPEAAAMMGGLFDGHPWGAGGTWAVKIDEPDHPLNRSFERKAFLIGDEIYQIKGPYSRDTHRVLLSLDMSNLRNHQVEGIKREDDDFAISWIRPFGEGRVFYCSLGHNLEVLRNEAVLGHYLAGIQYALGDLEADDTPSNALSVKPRPALTTDAGAVEDPFSTVVHQEFGFSRLSQATIEAGIRNSSPAHHGAIEERLIEILDNPESTYAARQFVCRMLRRIGPDRSLPHLTRMLLDEELTDDARYAMQGHDSPEIDAILRGALDQLEGPALIGVIGTIGQRRDRSAVTRLVSLTGQGDTRLTRACVTSLGRIGGSQAQEALFGLELPRELEPLRQDALLRCADNLVNEGAITEATAMYRRMTTDEFPVPVRIASWRGLVLSQQETAAPSFLTMLRSEEPEIQKAGARFLIEMRDAVDMMPVAEALDSFPVSAQALAISALASSGARQATSIVVSFVESDDDAVRHAAIRAVGDLGDASHVPLLVRIAVSIEDETSLPARDSLVRLRGEGVDERIITAANEQSDLARALLIEVLYSRHTVLAVPTFLTHAEDRNEKVRLASIRALADLADIRQLPELFGLLSRVSDEEDRNGIEGAILALCERQPDEDREDVIDLLLLNSERIPRLRLSLLRVVGNLHGDTALGALTTVTADEDTQVRLVAIEALGKWPDATPMETLLKVAESSSMENERTLALAGVLRLMERPNERTSEVNEQLYQSFFDLARTSAEKELVLDGLAGSSDLWIFGMVEPLLDDPALTEKAGAIRADLIEAVARTVSHDAAGRPVTHAVPYAEQYDGGGNNALTDDRWGSTNAGDGTWQGFEGENLDAVIDLGRVMDIHSIRAGFLEANESWIFLPGEVTFSIAGADRDFEVVASFTIPVPGSQQPAATRSFSTELSGKTARYVRIFAKNIGTLPSWHSGAGGRAWLFADEIQVNAHLEKR